MRRTRPFMCALLTFALLCAGCAGPGQNASSNMPKADGGSIHIVLADTAKPADVDALELDIMRMPGTISVIYRSKAENTALLKQRLAQKPQLLAQLHGTLAPSSLEVSLAVGANGDDIVVLIRRDPHTPRVVPDPNNPAAGNITYHPPGG